jgi:membrane associated rhomboid family serine protease
MDRLFAKLERRLSAIAVPQLMTFIVGGTAMVWLLSQLRPQYVDLLTLDLDAVRARQFWRLITFIFVPPLTGHPIFLLLKLWFMWWLGTTLEEHWGAFKFNAYVLAGVLAAIGAAALSGGRLYGNWLDGADAGLIFAFATIAPRSQLGIMFLPVRADLFALLAAVWLGYFFWYGEGPSRLAIGAVVVVYALFFAGHWRRLARERWGVAAQRARRTEFDARGPSSIGQRSCAMCGAREADGADIRVCSCARCGGKPRMMCLEHARSHLLS